MRIDLSRLYSLVSIVWCALQGSNWPTALLHSSSLSKNSSRSVCNCLLKPKGIYLMGKKGKNKEKGTVAAGEEQGGDQTTPAVSSPSKGGKRTKDEIDDIFAVVKKTKPDEASKAEDKDKQPGADTNPGSQKPAKVKGSVDDIFGVETGKQRKRTDEGYVIYHEDELSMNKGGDTEQCPFDCKCCF